MKILVLSLLRLGDIIQQGPLLKGLRKQFPQAEIHLLINKQFANVQEVLGTSVDKYVYLDREALQRGLSEPAFNILWSHAKLQNLITDLNAEKYDQAFNFTHNKLSGYLLGALDIPLKKGLSHSENRFQGLDNLWLKYFNDRFSGTQKTLFHYVELLGNAFGIPVTRTEALIGRKKSKLILFQTLTSDKKKNWGMSQFRDLKTVIEKSLVDYKVKVLGAEFEKAELLKSFDEEDLLICSLAEANQYLEQAALLVTGDTSIKHLAAQAGVPVVELALGSSDPTKTAAFSESSVVVKTQVPCAPCVHSLGCSQKSHLCAEAMSVDQVFAAVWDQLVSEKVRSENVMHLFDRATWNHHLNQSNRITAMTFAEILERSNAPDIKLALKRWEERSEQYGKWMEQLTQALPARSEMVAKKQLQVADISELILVAQDILKANIDEAGYFQSLIEALLSRFSSPVQMYDRIKKSLDEVHELLVIRKELAVHLQTLSMEGAYYAKGIGQLSIDGFTEAGKGLQRNLEDAEL